MYAHIQTEPPQTLPWKVEKSVVTQEEETHADIKTQNYSCLDC